MFKWFKKDVEDDFEDEKDNGKLTKMDFLKSSVIIFGVLCLFGIFNLMIDKATCAYKGYTYEKPTKRPIFSECLIQMKDGSYVPLERYINRVLTFNDLGNVDQ